MAERAKIVHLCDAHVYTGRHLLRGSGKNKIVGTIAEPRNYVDGRFLRPVLDGSVTSWRSAILLEAAASYSQAYRGIRTVSTNTISGRKYVEYAGGARELYNLESDGYELTNSYDAAARPTSLATRIQALNVCAADTCRTAEDGP